MCGEHPGRCRCCAAPAPCCMGWDGPMGGGSGRSMEIVSRHRRPLAALCSPLGWTSTLTLVPTRLQGYHLFPCPYIPGIEPFSPGMGSGLLEHAIGTVKSVPVSVTCFPCSVRRNRERERDREREREREWNRFKVSNFMGSLSTLGLGVPHGHATPL
ncbi:hypothetical protein KC19_2G083000 [Ceratodon purpureus]|uniref:Uncharacterized protein n=1 Tax=Ceratodon purpureus TaxID=3225 RepID=A0A8T0IUI0_CERPU|nr:hypothetical protein KC19_2G083000 [Ceratodon purpureus]